MVRALSMQLVKQNQANLTYHIIGSLFPTESIGSEMVRCQRGSLGTRNCLHGSCTRLQFFACSQDLPRYF